MQPERGREMKAISFKARNILGIKEISIEPGQITVISGRNAAGKSSIIEGIRTAVGGGNLASLRSLDAGEDEPSEVGIVFDSDSGQIRLDKSEKGLKVRKQVGNTAAFEDVPSPQRFLDSLQDAKAANPITFLNAPDKDRMQMLLEALPIEFNRDEMWEFICLKADEFSPVATGMHPLVEIAEHRKNIFNERTGVNRDEKSARSTVDQLKRAVPAEIPTAEDVRELEEELGLLNEQYSKIKMEAKFSYESKIKNSNVELSLFEAEKRTEFTEYQAELAAEMDRKLSKKRVYIDQEITTMKENRDSFQEKCRNTYERDMEAAEKLCPQIDNLRQIIGARREQEKEAVRIKILYEEIKRHESNAIDLKRKSDYLTDAINLLDMYKTKLCGDIHVEGLEIVDGDILIDGKPWKFTNEGRRMEIAVDVSCLRFSKLRDDDLRLIYIDGAEALDTENFNKLCDRIKYHNAQAIICRVTDDPELRIEKI
jgi:energy-coupling factor transporter ATP-binding protein EcfA2